MNELQEAFAVFLSQLLQDTTLPGLGERFTCLLNRAVGVLGLLKRGKDPLTAVAALVRDKPKKFLKRLGLLK